MEIGSWGSPSNQCTSYPLSVLDFIAASWHCSAMADLCVKCGSPRVLLLTSYACGCPREGTSKYSLRDQRDQRGFAGWVYLFTVRLVEGVTPFDNFFGTLEQLVAKGMHSNVVEAFRDSDENVCHFLEFLAPSRSHFDCILG